MPGGHGIPSGEGNRKNRPMIGNLVNWVSVAAWVVAAAVAVRFHFITSATSDGASSPVVPVLALVGAGACGVMAIRATRDAIRGEPKVDKPVRHKPKPRPPAAPFTEEDRQLAGTILAALVESGAIIEGEVTADAVVARLEREEEEPPLDTHMFLSGLGLLQGDMPPLRRFAFLLTDGLMDDREIVEIVSDLLRVFGRDVSPDMISAGRPAPETQTMQVEFEIDGESRSMRFTHDGSYLPPGLLDGFELLAIEKGWPPLASSHFGQWIGVTSMSEDKRLQLNAGLPDDVCNFYGPNDR